MRVVLIFVIAHFLQLHVKAQSIEDSLEVKISVIKEVDTTVKKDDVFWDIQHNQAHVASDSVRQKRFNIEISVQNKSRRLANIYLMSCSWWDNFLVNNDYIYIDVHDCSKNIPEIVPIKAGESYIINTTLLKSIKFDYPCVGCIYGQQVERTKLGLVAFNAPINNIIDYELDMADRSTWKIIWSNAIYILGQQPQPKSISNPRN